MAFVGLLAGATALGISTSAHAAGEVPAGPSFDIWYYLTDEEGNRDRFFSEADLTSFVNKARCECNQAISTRIRLQRAMTVYDPNVFIRTYVGNRCDLATTPNQQAKPCVRVANSSPNAYTNQINFSFAPIWLATGVDPSGSQDVADATPYGTCDTGQGDAGVWICVESNDTPDCQQEEFLVKGKQNENISTMGSEKGITFDFDPPQTLPSQDSFSVESGEGQVLIRWQQIPSGDVNGYRVLCADANGNPLPDRGEGPPSLTGRNIGRVYFTKQSLCPDGPFGEMGGSGGSDGGSGGDGSTGAGTSGDVGTTGGDVGTTGAGTSGPDATATADGGTTAATGGATSGGVAELPAEGIESLDWRYMCSGHVAATSQQTRVSGLDNEVPYQFLVVAYDVAGNPVAASKVLTGTPRETTDLWEQCEIDGNVCGDGGFCNCSAAPTRAQDLAWFAAVAGAGLGLRRRRRRA